jgi:uncharacterized protein (DUF885 family)
VTDLSEITRPPTPVDAFADRFFDATLDLDPVLATAVGVPGHDDQLTDYSPSGHEARAELIRATLRELDGQAPVDEVDSVTVATLRDRLSFELGRHEAALDVSALNNVDSPVQWLREVFDIAPTATAEDWESITARLAAMPAALAGYRASLTYARLHGRVHAQRQVVAAARQAEQFGASDGFFVRLAADAETSEGPVAGELSTRLRAASAGAAGAYAELAIWLREEMLTGSRDDDAAGRDEYSLLARGFLGTSVDLEETYAWGLDELARIEDRMVAVAREITPDASTASDTAAALLAGIAALDADPATSIEGAEAFRDWMQALSDAAIEGLAGTHFDIPVQLRALACRIAPTTAGGFYYTGPSDDFSRPGQMWRSVPEGVTRFSTWREASTVYHEGVPGHHLQVAQTVYLRERLNRWRRLAAWVSGHGEGWALYAERLMEELGFLEDRGRLMGMLDGQALRATRVVVDIGVHCQLPAPAEVGGGTWDAAKAWAFLRAHTRVPDPTLRFELERYLGWPAQAISYKVGERTWLALREDVKAHQGADFDLRAFHRRSLEVGSVPLDVLRSAVLAG